MGQLPPLPPHPLPPPPSPPSSPSCKKTLSCNTHVQASLLCLLDADVLGRLVQFPLSQHILLPSPQRKILFPSCITRLEQPTVCTKSFSSFSERAITECFSRSQCSMTKHLCPSERTSTLITAERVQVKFLFIVS